MTSEEPSLTTSGTPGPRGQISEIRIGRGAIAMGSDGALGRVQQIIMDQRTGELQALVIATDDTHLLELPASHVLRATGDTVYVDVSMADLRDNPEMAAPYNPDRYIPVRENPFLAPSEASRGARFSERPVVTNIEHDAVGVVVPQPSTPAADVVASMTTPEAERYVTEPGPAPDAEPAPDTTTSAEEAVHSEIREPEDTSATPSGADISEPGADKPDKPELPPSEEPSHGHGPFPPSKLTPTAPLIERTDDEAAPAKTVPAEEEPATGEPPADFTVESAADLSAGSMRTHMLVGEDEIPTATAIPIVTSVTGSVMPSATDTYATASLSDDSKANTAQTGLDIAADAEGAERYSRPDAVTEDVTEDVEEDRFMEGSVPPVNPVNPGVMSDTIHDDHNTIADALDESRQSYAWSPPEVSRRGWGRRGLASSSSEYGNNQLSWAPAAALGALIVGIAVWSTLRAIRRGRRKAAEAARNARYSAESLRASVRDSMRDAGKSAVGLAQTMRASAQEVAANPRESATDALSKFSDIPARYRWFRRGIRVGARSARMRRK